MLGIPQFLKLRVKMAFKIIWNQFFQIIYNFISIFFFSQPTAFLPTLLRCREQPPGQCGKRAPTLAQRTVEDNAYLPVTLLKSRKKHMDPA